MKIAMLGSGFIARFYADSLLAQRAKDTLISVYSRNIEKAKQFSEDYGLSFYSDDMDTVVGREDVDAVSYLAAQQPARSRSGSLCKSQKTCFMYQAAGPQCC